MPKLTSLLHFLVCNWILSLLTLTDFSDTYFRVFKLWFTLRASARVVAPESPISFLSRLWKSTKGVNSSAY